MIALHSEKIVEKKSTLSIFFSIYFVIMLFGENYGFNSESLLYQLVTIAAIACLIIKIIFTQYSFKEYILAALLFTISIFVFTNTGKIAIVFTIITLIASKNVDIKEIITYAYYTLICVLILNVTLPLLGLKESIYLTHNRNLFGQTVTVGRYGFGYGHPNAFHLAIMLIISINVYLNFDHYKVKNYFILFLINILTYSFSQSRTGFITTMLFLFISYTFKHVNLKKFRYLLISFSIVMPILFVILAYSFSYSSNFFVELDHLFQGRLNYSAYFLNRYPLSIFGNRVVFDSWQIIDSSYIEMIVSYGVLIYILFIISHFLFFKKGIKNNYKAALVIVIMFLIYGNLEVILPNIFKNYSLLFLSTLIFEET